MTMRQLFKAVGLTMEQSGEGNGNLRSWKPETAMARASMSCGPKEPWSDSEPVHFRMGASDSCSEPAFEWRQRAAADGAHVQMNTKLPGPSSKSYFDTPQLEMCEYRTAAGALFYRVGAVVRLEDGYMSFSREYKITCAKIAHKSSEVVPRCLRGKVFGGGKADDRWDKDRATRALGDSYLREWRIDGASALRPRWVKVRATGNWVEEPSPGSERPNPIVPVALRALGMDGQPLAFYGEPPIASRPGVEPAPVTETFERHGRSITTTYVPFSDQDYDFFEYLDDDPMKRTDESDHDDRSAGGGRGAPSSPPPAKKPAGKKRKKPAAKKKATVPPAGGSKKRQRTAEEGGGAAAAAAAFAEGDRVVAHTYPGFSGRQAFKGVVERVVTTGRYKGMYDVYYSDENENGFTKAEWMTKSDD